MSDTFVTMGMLEARVKELEAHLANKEVLILGIGKELTEARGEMDRVERASGDAPHPAVSLADRIRVQFERGRDETILLQDACGLEMVDRPGLARALPRPVPVVRESL